MAVGKAVTHARCPGGRLFGHVAYDRAETTRFQGTAHIRVT